MKLSIKDRLVAAFRTKDEATIRATLDAIPDDEGGDVHIHMNTSSDEPETKDEADPMEERLSRIEAAIAALSATKDSDDNGDDDDADETTDSGEEDDKDKTEDDDGVEKFTGDAKSVMSKAAIIAPAYKPKATKDAKGSMDSVKRDVLAHAATTDAGAKIVNSVLAGRSLKSLKGVALGITFDAVAAMMAQHNNTKDSVKPATADTIYTKGDQLKANIAAMRAARTKQF